MYTAEQDNIGQAVSIAKQICIEYQMVLTCLHTALIDCPTMKNLKRVQATLDSHWVTKINELCSIQSKSSSDAANNDYKDLTNYIYQNNHPNHVDSYKIAREILHASMKTKAELEREVLAAKAQSGLSSIFIEKIHYFQPPQDNEEVKEIKEQNKDAKVELNIVNVIQNYNYPTAQKNDAIKHSTVHLVHAAHNSATGSSYGILLVVLSAVATLRLLLL
ncbi:uncharacterized protein LOC131955423 [Physella acuta]|uniref:uncharacterized protein LOC131955423 n=1 Tax=Physella acuta TaxID=109671 RepID=UPI0027DC7CD3|nr:uncharacterized protein LOC131955423 [Physella acuta]